MKVGIDISAVIYGTGVSIYTKNLVENLLEIDQNNEYQLFFSSLRQNIRDWRQEIRDRGQKYNICRIPPTGLDILWNKLHIVPVEWLVGETDVFHCSDWTQPPAKKAKLITTIHDLSFLRWPETAHPKVVAAQKNRLKWVEKEADAVIAISEATKKEIIELTEIPEDKITVIYEGLPTDVGNFQFSKVKEKYNIKDKFILAMGSQAPRKNLKRLIKSYELLVTNYELKNIDLIITGRYESKDKLPKGVITTGFLDRNELLSLMQKAEVFVYPSLYEGFGLPILEAFSLETPVVTSNCSSMAEVADNAAVLVEPESVESISKGIANVLQNRQLRADLVKKGRKRLKDFSWQKTAKQTLDVYDRVLNI